MVARFIVLIFVLSSNFAFSDENLVDTKTVISEGVGIDPQSAAQNAAENALKNVVGSFMDANTLLEKRTLIDDGIKSETKNISNNIKEYSQGSIKSFEIVETKQEAGLFKLTAKVAVRNENFSAYIKKIAQGETKVGGGLFAQMATEIKQNDNLISILKDNVISPILSGEVQEFNVDTPMLLSQAIKDNKLPEWVTRSINENAKVNPKLLIFKIKTQLKKSFLDNLNKTLSSTATSTKKCLPNERVDWCVTKIVNLQPKNVEFFNYKGIKSELSRGFDCFRQKSCQIPSLNIAIKDTQNSILMSDKINFYGNSNGASIIRFRTYDYTGIGKLDPNNRDEIPWLLVKDSFFRLSNYSLPNLILEENTFYVVLSVEPDVIKNADKILVTLEK